MSASCVKRGNPCSRAASAPIRTYWTWCRASVVKSSSGSSGGGPGTTRLDTAHVMEKATDVLDFLHTLLRRHGEDPRYLGQHMRANDHTWLSVRDHIIVCCPQEAFKRVPGRAGLAAFNPGDGGLGSPRPLGEGSLAEARPSAGF